MPKVLQRRLMRALFYLLYHHAAILYDLVAGFVSLGQWNEWIETALAYTDGGPLLELGFGTGHLQHRLLESGRDVVGIDESAQMVELAGRRLHSAGMEPRPLVRARAQQIPFRSRCFDNVVTAFPSEYIFDPGTLREVRRILCDEGRLVVVLMAWHQGSSLLSKLMACLFRITGESSNNPEETAQLFGQRLGAADLHVQVKMVDLEASRVLVLVARKARDGKAAWQDFENPLVA